MLKLQLLQNKQHEVRMARRNWKYVLSHIGKSINPNNYQTLSEKPLSHTVSLFFRVLVIALVLFVLASVPVITSVKDSLSEDIESFSSFKLSAEYNVTEPVTLSEHPRIVVAPDNATVSKAFLYLTPSTVYQKNIFGRQKATSYNTTYDFKEKTGDIASLVNMLAVLLLPGLTIVFGIIAIILSFVIVMISSLITIIFKKKTLEFRDLIVIGVHALLLPLLVFAVSVPLHISVLYSLGLYVVLFVLGVLIVKGHELRSVGHHKE